MKRHSDRWMAAILGIASLAVYGVTLAPTVLFGDAGEFQFAAPAAGVAHPTGYPLYMLLGWLWTHLLPVGTPALRMNLFSAVAGAAAVSVLHLTIRRFLDLANAPRSRTLSRGIAILGASAFALSGTFWSQAIIAEVYALNALLVAMTLYLLMRWLSDGRRWTDLIPLAVVMGLGLAHHRTTILLIPAVALTVWASAREGRAPALRWGSVGALAGLAILPLALYLYVPLRANHTDYLTVPLDESTPLGLYHNDVSGFLHYVLGRSFEGSIRLSILSPDRLQMAVTLLRDQFHLAGILLGLLGLGWLMVSRRRILLAATLPAYLFLVGFNLIYDIGDIFVFYIPTYLVWALWMSLGVTWIHRQINTLLMRRQGLAARNGQIGGPSRRRSYGTQQLAGWIVLGVVALLPLSLLIQNLPAVNRHYDWEAWAMWQRILAQPLPEGAVLISNDRDEIMPMWYFQQIQGQRPDLIGLFPHIVEDPAYEDVGLIIDQALASNRPVYLIKPMPGLNVRFSMAPAQAGMHEVLGPSVTAEPARQTDVLLGDKVRLIGYEHRPYSVSPGKELTVILYWQPQVQLESDYSTFVQLLDRNGNRLVGNDQLPGGAFYPTSLWKPGEVLRDAHRLTVPTDLPLGAYRLYVGMYKYPSMERIGDATLGYIGVKSAIEIEPVVPPNPMQIYFEDKILFHGYELRKEGQSLLLTLEWQALSTMQHDYHTFVHLVDAEGNKVSQADSQPLGGTYPTSIWDKGEVVIDAYRLPIEMDTPEGEYRLLVGLYRLETMERLATLDAGGNVLGDSVELQTVHWP